MPLVLHVSVWKNADLRPLSWVTSHLPVLPKPAESLESANLLAQKTEKKSSTALDAMAGSKLDPISASWVLGAGLSFAAAALLRGKVVHRVNRSILIPAARSAARAMPQATVLARRSTVDSAARRNPNEQARMAAMLEISEAAAIGPQLFFDNTGAKSELLSRHPVAKEEFAESNSLAASQVMFNSVPHVEDSRLVSSSCDATGMPGVDVAFSVMANMPLELKARLGEDTGAYVHDGVVRPRPRTSSKLFRIVP